MLSLRVGARLPAGLVTWSLVLAGCTDRGHTATCEPPEDGEGSWSHSEPPEELGYLALDWLGRDSRNDQLGFRNWGERIEFVTLDVLSGTWTSVEHPNQTTYYGQGFAFHERWALALGDWSSETPMDRPPSTALLDRDTGEWSSVVQPEDYFPPLYPPIFGVGSVFVTFGQEARDSQDGDAVAEAFALDPVAGSWSKLAAPPWKGIDGGSTSDWPGTYAVQGDRLLVTASGVNGTQAVIAIYDVSEGAWSTIPFAPEQAPRVGSSVVWQGDDLFLGGGWEGASFRDLWRYSFASETWTRVSLPSWVDVWTVVPVGERIAVQGSCRGRALFDPASDEWTPMTLVGSPEEVGNRGSVLIGIAGRAVAAEIHTEGEGVDGVFIFEP